MNIQSLVKNALTVRQNKRYERICQDKKVTYDQWITQEEKSYSVNPGEWKEADKKPLFFYVFLGREGILAENALEEIARFFISHSQVQLLYGDEDVKSEVRTDPWFKPEWSPDTFLSWYYFGSLTAVRGDLAGKAGLPEEWNHIHSEDLNGKQQEKHTGDLPGNRIILDNMPWVTVDILPYPHWNRWKTYIERLISLAGGFQRSCRSIGHIPKILFHSGSVKAQEEYFAWTLEEKNTDAARADQDWKDGNIQVSVIIPSKDNPEILNKAILSLIRTVKDTAYEIIIVDNGSTEKNKAVIERFIKDFINKVNITLIYHPMKFNFSLMCNMGAEKSEGKHLLFLNDDVEMARTGWMERMVDKSRQKYTGAVGLKLYYPESVRIQHGGITNLPMGPVHKLQFLEDNKSYYYGKNSFDSNVLAVTGACLLVEREKFRLAQGFPEELPVAFNDVDLCFQLYELGYSNVVINTFSAWHHESLSRGQDESCEKLKRLLKERDKLYVRHPGLQGEDPYYPRGLSRIGLDTVIRPEYQTSGNQIQPFIMKEMTVPKLSGYRQDQCLLVRIEYSGTDKIYGYGVVLGDNNACYRKSLLLGKSDDTGDSKWTLSRLWSQELAQQYRPDLEENMGDQCNVALSGFWLDLSGQQLPAGEYRIGMTAVSKAGTQKLINWSNRFLQIK